MVIHFRASQLARASASDLERWAMPASMIISPSLALEPLVPGELDGVELVVE